MIKKINWLVILVLMLSASCQPAPTVTPIPPTPTLASEFRGRFVVIKPSAQDETDRIWSTLKNMAFYDQFGYNLVFPKDSDMQVLVQKARDKKLTYQDYDALSKLMTEKWFNSSNYERGYSKTIDSLPTVEQVLPRFQDYNAKWGFKLFPTYKIRLTLYGVGGSYNPQVGEIIVLTTQDGNFPRGPNPTDTIVHESVHLGIEGPVIAQYAIEQRTKERIVDRFIYDNFRHLFPGYVLNSTMDTSVDKYLQGSDAYDNLPDRIRQFKEGK